jgi:hypothetical protein
MKEEVRRRIDTIRAGMECPKGFICDESGFQHLCKARDRGLEEFVDCLADDRAGCGFALSFGHGHLCQCPLRIYVARKLRK